MAAFDFAIWPTIDPIDPAAAETTTVSPAARVTKDRSPFNTIVGSAAIKESILSMESMPADGKSNSVIGRNRRGSCKGVLYRKRPRGVSAGMSWLAAYLGLDLTAAGQRQPLLVAHLHEAAVI